jgi:hypothetical protein
MLGLVRVLSSGKFVRANALIHSSNPTRRIAGRRNQ